MNLKDQFCSMVGAYYGIRELDEYPLKEYVLYDLEMYIKNFVKENHLEFNYQEIAEEIEKLPLKSKLQDCLLILSKIHASMELILLVKSKIQELREKEL